MEIRAETDYDPLRGHVRTGNYQFMMITSEELLAIHRGLLKLINAEVDSIAMQLIEVIEEA